MLTISGIDTEVSIGKISYKTQLLLGHGTHGTVVFKYVIVIITVLYIIICVFYVYK